MNAIVLSLVNKNLWSKIGFALKKRAPEIGLAVGATAVVGGTILACKNTMNMPDILGKTKEEINGIHAMAEEAERGDTPENEPVYDKKAMRKDLRKAYARFGWRVVKNYAGPVLLETSGLGLIFGSHKILKDRNASLALVAAATDKAFQEYKKRVEEKYGEEAAKEIQYGVTEEKISEEVTDDTGKKKVVKKSVKISGEELGPYVRCFDVGSPGWVPDPELRLLYLRGQERLANDMLRAKGFMWLNEVYKELGFQETALGHTVGWIYDPSNPNLHNYISFDITNSHRKSVRDFVNGIEDAVWLDFNVDGPILEKAVKLGFIHEDRRTS